jgi:hypothetical protein
MKAFLVSFGRILITAVLAGIIGYLLYFNARLIANASMQVGFKQGQLSCIQRTGVLEATGDDAWVIDGYL